MGAGLAIASAIQVSLALLGRALGSGPAAAGGGTASGLVPALGGSAILAISLYVGGSATRRIAGARAADRATLHGVVLWALSTLLAAWVAATGGRHAAGAALGLPGAVEVPATRDAIASAWLALLGLGVGLTAAVGGVRGWLRPPSRRDATPREHGPAGAGPRAALAPPRPDAGSPTHPDDSPDGAARRPRSPTPED